MKNYRVKIRTVLICIIAFGLATPVKAQIDPLGAMYFSNQYLGNPAMAGLADGIELSLGYRSQLSGLQGALAAQSLSGTFRIDERIAFGVNVYRENVGVLKRMRILGSYSYALPLSDAKKSIRFGFSFGFQNQHIDDDELNSDSGDQVIADYNAQGIYLDGTFGLAYTTKTFQMQFAIPNLKNGFKRDITANTVNRSTFYSAASYKIDLQSIEKSVFLEPKLAFRGVKGFPGIVDIGTRLSLTDYKISVMTFYHTSNNATFGLGFDLKNFDINTMYNTSTGQFKGYVGGNVEVNLKLKLKSF